MPDPPHPGEFIAGVYLEPFGVTGRALAKHLGVAPSPDPATPPQPSSSPAPQAPASTCSVLPELSSFRAMKASTKPRAQQDASFSPTRTGKDDISFQGQQCQP